MLHTSIRLVPSLLALATATAASSAALNIDISSQTITSAENADDVYIGYDNGGLSLTISNGGTLTNISGTLGVNGTSDGNTVLVTGTGSAWTNSGDLNVGFLGADNILTIADDGAVTANYTKLGGYNASTGNMVVLNSGATLTNSNDILIGYGGDGNMLTINNGSANNVNAFIGYQASSDHNVVAVIGDESVWTNSGVLHLGYEGGGNTLNITEGGIVNVDSTDAIIGFGESSNGNTLLVDGEGSAFTNISGTLYLGRLGNNNALTVENGGVVTSKDVRIGAGSNTVANSGNSATVDGDGSVWTISSKLRVGYYGHDNSLEILNGGVVNVANATSIGHFDTADNNNILVSGEGSELNVQELTIGRVAGAVNNVVTLVDGGTLSATAIILGQDSGIEIGDGDTTGYVESATFGPLTITGALAGSFITFDHAETAYTFDAILAGTLGVTHNGTGTTILTANNSYAGETRINAGTLKINGAILGSVFVDDTATLGGSGSFGGGVIASGGTLAPGNSIGTISSSGNVTFEGGSIFEIEANADGNADKLVVDGVADLDGMVVVKVAPGLYASSTNYTILTANSLTGSFAIAEPEAGFFTYGLNQDAENVYLSIHRNSFASVSRTRNQTAVGIALDDAIPSAETEEGEELLIDILGMSGAKARSAYEALSGEGLIVAQAAAFSANDLFVSALGRQSNDWLANNSTNGWHLWGTGLDGQTKLEGQTSIIGSADQRTDSSGIAAGIDMVLGNDVMIGAAIGSTDAHFRAAERETSGSADAMHLGLYGAVKGKALFASASLSYANLSNKTLRTLSAIGQESIQQARFDIDILSARLEIGYKPAGAKTMLYPFASIELTRLDQEKFSESGGVGNLDVHSTTRYSIPASIGVQFEDSRGLVSGWTLAPKLRAAFVHNFETQRSLSASLPALSDTMFTVDGASAARNAGKVGLSLSIANAKGLSLFVAGDAAVFAGGQTLQGQAGLKFGW